MTKTTACKHENVTAIDERPFTGPVAQHAQFANPTAHGCITLTIECDDCKATRHENRNAGQAEVGPWSTSRQLPGGITPGRSWAVPMGDLAVAMPGKVGGR